MKTKFQSRRLLCKISHCNKDDDAMDWHVKFSNTFCCKSVLKMNNSHNQRCWILASCHIFEYLLVQVYEDRLNFPFEIRMSLCTMVDMMS
jgi:hypothetical protein